MSFKFWADGEEGKCGFHFGGDRDRRSFRGRGWGRSDHPLSGNPFGGAERLFDQGDLRFVILYLVAERPRHGYEIIKAIEEATGGSYAPSPGVVYPTLTMLEEMGLASVENTEGSKKLYTVTDEGRRVLQENESKVKSILERMHNTGNQFTAGSVMRIFQAMVQLKQTTKILVKRGNLSDEHVKVVAEALEEAVRKIQNL